MRALVCQFSVARLVTTRLLGYASARAYLGPWAPIALTEIADPELPGDDWVLLRTRLAGICGSDYKQIFLDGSRDSAMTALVSFPQVLGHEVVADVESIGRRVSGIRVGDRVVLNPWLSCGPRGIEPPCPSCREGRYNNCYHFAEGRLSPGVHTGNCAEATGGFAPLLPAHCSQCIAVPSRITDDAAVLADPAAVALHAVLGHPPTPGEPALVYGCGTLGLLVIRLLRLLHPDVPVMAVARYPHQAQLAGEFGAGEVVPWRPVAGIVRRVAEQTGTRELRPWLGNPWLLGGVACVYDTVGAAETVEIALRIARPRATVVVIGVESPKRFEWTPLYFKEVTVAGSNAFGVESFEGRRLHAMDVYFELVRRGLDVTRIISHRYALESYREAFLACYHQGAERAVKVLFDFRSTAEPVAVRAPQSVPGRLRVAEASVLATRGRPG